MSGNRKMYKRGLADAMQAYEGFSEKQKAALEQLRREVESGTKQLETALEDLGDELNGIYQYLNAKEKAALYHLSTPLDIKKLDLPEQQLLIAILYQLADDEGALLTEYQRTYIRSIQRYLGITNPQTNADLSVVGDIDSLDTQKAFLQVTLEFFYLQNGEELTDAQEDFLGNFSVNKKQALAIERCVSRLYNAVDAQGVAEKYGTQADEQSSPEAIEQAISSLESVLNNFKCGVYKYCYISLDTSDHWVSAYDRVFKSKDECRQKAERRLDKAYREAENKMAEYFRASRSGSFYSGFKESFDRGLNWLRKCVKELRSASTVVVTDKMDSYLTASKIYEKAKDVNEKLSSKYSLSSVNRHTSDIEYETHDPSEYEEGFSKLFAKAFKSYGFNCFNAIYKIQEDAISNLEAFQEDFNDEMQDEILIKIVEPIQDLLPQLREAMNPPAE